jgi:hypothetical protein
MLSLSLGSLDCAKIKVNDSKHKAMSHVCMLRGEQKMQAETTAGAAGQRHQDVREASSKATGAQE